jgi:hypothetical protein
MPPIGCGSIVDFRTETVDHEIVKPTVCGEPSTVAHRNRPQYAASSNPDVRRSFIRVPSPSLVTACHRPFCVRGAKPVAALGKQKRPHNIEFWIFKA